MQDPNIRLHDSRPTSLERATIEGDSPVVEREVHGREFLSKVGHEKSGPNPGGPPSKAKQGERSIADSTVRER